MGPPIGGTPPGDSGSLQVDTTVDSVGPYALIILRPGAHRSTSSAVHASPPTITVRNAGRALAATSSGTVASAAGGMRACVTDCSEITLASSAPSGAPDGGTTR